MKKHSMVVFLFLMVSRIWAQNSLDWTLALVDVRTDAALSFSRPISLKTDDTFTLYIESEMPCYCYIILQDSEQNIGVLQNRNLARGEELRLPVVITPPSGSETFYIVMSLTEQRDLNAKIGAFQKDSSPRSSRELIQEVSRLRRTLSSLKESAEKPVFMGGAFRGENTKSEGLEFSGAGVYVKTITINH